MTTLRGRIWDRGTGRPLEARVQVLASTGQFRAPEGAILKVGAGQPFFYSDGTFEVDVPVGQADIVVERGTEYRPLRLCRRRAGRRRRRSRPAARALDPACPSEGWYAGNTHVHYDEKETRAARSAAARSARRGPAGARRQRAEAARPGVRLERLPDRAPRALDAASTSSTSARRAATTTSPGTSGSATSC